MKPLIERFRNLTNLQKSIVVMSVLTVILGLFLFVFGERGGEGGDIENGNGGNEINTSGLYFPEDVSEDVNSWSVYEEENLGFSVRLPEGNNTKTKVEEGLFYFIYTGKNQVVNSEITDGIVMTFEIEQGESGEDLTGYVQNKIDYLEDHGYTVVGDPKSVDMGVNEALTFDVWGYGKQKYYFSKNGDNYLKVVDLTDDSNNEGYEDVVKVILKTVQF